MSTLGDWGPTLGAPYTPLTGSGTITISGSGALGATTALAGTAAILLIGNGSIPIDGVVLLEGTASLAIGGAAYATVPIDLGGSGSISVGGTAVLSLRETVCEEEPPVPQPSGDDVLRWTFYDPTGPETYTFDINPREGGTPSESRSFTFEKTVDPNGRAIVFEGRKDPRVISFSGTILEQGHLEAFQSWVNRPRQIRIADDLGRSFWVVFRRFEPRRRRSALYPWRHDYSVEAIEVDAP